MISARRARRVDGLGRGVVYTILVRTSPGLLMSKQNLILLPTNSLTHSLTHPQAHTHTHTPKPSKKLFKFRLSSVEIHPTPLSHPPLLGLRWDEKLIPFLLLVREEGFLKKEKERAEWGLVDTSRKIKSVAEENHKITNQPTKEPVLKNWNAWASLPLSHLHRILASFKQTPPIKLD